MYTPYRGSMTPRFPMKRKLTFTPYSSAKRSKANVAQKFNRRTVTRQFTTKGTLYQQVRSLQNAVRKLAPEMKFVDSSLAVTNVTTSGQVLHVTPVAQGDTSLTRTGDAIYVKQIAVRFRMDLGSDTAGNFGSRFAVIVDKQQVADTAPGNADIWQSAGGASVISGFLNEATLERFRVLWLSPYVSHAQVQNNQINNHWEYTNTALNLKVEYNGATSGDVQKNGIYFVWITNDTGNTMDGDGTCRIGFTDV